MISRFKKTRASFYKAVKRRFCLEQQDPVIHRLVMSYRHDLPRLGGKKVYHLIKNDLQLLNIKLGRDSFLNWLRANDLLIEPKKRYARTTNSLHRFKVHQNLIKTEVPRRSDHIWVSDITYLRTRKGFCYLALITDAYSRKIVGYDLSDSLELEGCLRALKMACRSRINENTIHHSDRGSQYCSTLYTETLRKHNIAISMAEAGNCYENAMAERVNGILKTELNLDAIFETTKHAQKATKQAVETYNNKRPHMAIGLKKPSEVYAA